MDHYWRFGDDTGQLNFDCGGSWPTPTERSRVAPRLIAEVLWKHLDGRAACKDWRTNASSSVPITIILGEQSQFTNSSNGQHWLWTRRRGHLGIDCEGMISEGCYGGSSNLAWLLPMIQLGTPSQEGSNCKIKVSRRCLILMYLVVTSEIRKAFRVQEP